MFFVGCCAGKFLGNFPGWVHKNELKLCQIPYHAPKMLRHLRPLSSVPLRRLSTNTNPRLCVNCVHYYSGLCTAIPPFHVHPLTGETTYNLAQTGRSSTLMCGPEGKLFESLKIKNDNENRIMLFSFAAFWFVFIVLGVY